MDDGKAAGEPTPALENDFRLMFEAAGVGMVQVDPFTTRFLRVNRCFAEMTGYAAEELLGMSALELTHPDDRDRDRAEWEKTLWGESPQFAIEKRYVRKDGGVIWVSVVATVLRDAENHPLRAVSTVEDITERRHREASRELLAGISEDLGQLSGEEEIIRSVGAKLAAHLGLTCYHYVDVDEERAEVTVRHFWHRLEVPHVLGTYPISGFISPAWLNHLRAGKPAVVNDVQNDLPGDTPEVAGLRAGAAAQKIGAYVAVPCSQDGRWKAYFAVADSAPRRWTSLEIELIQEVSNRIFPRIERARAEKALRESEQRLRRVLDGMDEGFGLLAPDFTILEHNREALRLDGRPREQIVGRSHWEVYPGTEDSELGRLYKKAMAERVPVSLEHRYAWEDGHARWLEMRAYPTDDGMLAVFWRDVTERREAQDALRESEAKYRTLFETIDEGLCIIEMIYHETGQGVDFRYLEVNQAWGRLTGLENVVGKLGSEVLPNNESYWLEIFDKVVQTGESLRFENYHDETGRWYSAYISRVGHAGSRRVAIVFDNITERKERERQQEFLLKFSDALRAETDADNVANHALRMLSEQMSLDRCYIGVYRLEEDRADLTHQVGNERVPPLPDSIRLSDFPEAFRVVFDRTLVIEDFAKTEGLSDTDRRNIGALGLRALIAPSLRKGENNPLWTIVAVSARPRRWTRGEIALIEEVTERTWAAVERARAEETLRQSEEKYRSLFESIDEGVSTVEAIFDEQGKAIDYRYLENNPAVKNIFGFEWPTGKTVREFLPEVEDHWIETIGGVARTGEPVRIEYIVKSLNRWVSAYFSRVGGSDSRKVVAVYDDITERKRAEQRQAYLLKLSDALRPLTDPAEVQAAACRVLGEHLGADRVNYAEIEGEDYIVACEYRTAGLPTMIGRYPIASFRPAERAAFEAGRTVSVADIMAEPSLTAEEAVAYGALGVRAFVSIPLVKAGRLLVVFSVIRSRPGPFSPHEVAIIEETAERTWAAVERSRAEKALRESETRFRTVADLVPDLLWSNDPRGQATWHNRRWLEYTGQSLEEARGQGWLEAVHPHDREASLRSLEAAVGSGTPLLREHRIRRHDGEYRWFLARAEPHRDSQGHVLQWFGSMTDIHDLRETQRYRAWLASIVESSSDAIMSFDLERVVLSWNPAAERMFGYAAAEAVGQGLERFVPAGLEPEQAAIVERVRQGEHVVQHETFRLHKDGTPVPVSLTVSPIKDEHGAVIAATAIVQDIRERKRAEAALLESRERLALTLEAGSLGIWDSDLLTHRTYWSPEQERLFGLEPGSFDGGFSERLHPDDRERVLRRLAEVRAAGGDYEDEYRVVWPDGTVRWLAARGRVYRDPQGQAVRVLGVNFDITRRKEAEERLRASEARLQALVEAQKRFVADASHELRAPLMAIQGNLELVCRFPQLPEEERRAALEDARNEANRMTRLVNDLLILARGDAGTRLRLESLDLGEVLREALAEAQHFARGRALEAELPGRLGLRGDRDRIKQLALILLENALKYTPEGGKVRLELAKDGRWAELRVRDTGVGIAAEHLPHVFERFWRADRARARGEDPGGTGLGLSIARWIVEQHGGRIWLESEVGKGTTAIVRLPLGAEM